MDRLGVGHVTAVGHSSGCLVATALAEQRPDLVDALALIDMGPNLDAKAPDGLLFRLVSGRAIGPLLWKLRNEQSIRKTTESSGSFTRPVAVPDVFVSHMLAMTHRAFTQTMRASGHYLSDRDLPDRIAPMGVPLLVIFGAEDRRWRSSTASAYRSVPGARIEIIPEVGHTPMMEDPAVTARLLAQFAGTLRGS